jgi:hypothetical protein
MTLHNLGFLDWDQNRMEEARNEYAEALKIRRELAANGGNDRSSGLTSHPVIDWRSLGISRKPNENKGDFSISFWLFYNRV